MNYVGTARPIHDAKGKATGYSKYAGDISLSNMAYLCMLHSKDPHAMSRRSMRKRRWRFRAFTAFITA